MGGTREVVEEGEEEGVAKTSRKERTSNAPNYVYRVCDIYDH